jgi:alkaline phosphatase D
LSKPLLEERRGDDIRLRVAFGSCNKHDKDQSYWDAVEAQAQKRHFDYWVWAGDIIYGDTNVPAELDKKYSDFKESRRYKDFLELCKPPRCKVVGVWDDHDFGGNNLMGGDQSPDTIKMFEDFPKVERQRMLLKFLKSPVDPKDSKCPTWDRQNREGVYAAYDFKKNDIKVRLILLDLRYHRGPPEDGGPMMNGDQWEWLRCKLSDKSVEVHLIVSSTQVLRESTGLENKDTWAMYPEERKKLFNLITENNARGVIFLSGDIHGGEISKLRIEDAKDFKINYPLYEVTSSGLTHVRPLYLWTNKYQIGFTPKRNFGVIDIVKDKESLIAIATIFGVDGKEILRKNIQLE